MIITYITCKNKAEAEKKIKVTKIIGKAKLYKLNKDRFIIKKLIEIDDRLMIEDLKRHSKKKQIEVVH